MKQTKILHVVSICLIMLAIFGYTATVLRPAFQQDNNFMPEGKNTSFESPVVLQQEKPYPIYLADPIDDPSPH